jgi:hypothetical protein
MICGKSCLAGDIFGEFRFPEPLKAGDRLSIQDAAGYTMVKKNWFNGVKMPAIACGNWTEPSAWCAISATRISPRRCRDGPGPPNEEGHP